MMEDKWTNTLSRLLKHKGELLTAKEIKRICNYSPKTYIEDLSIIKDGLVVREPGCQHPLLYRVKGG